MVPGDRGLASRAHSRGPPRTHHRRGTGHTRAGYHLPAVPGPSMHRSTWLAALALLLSTTGLAHAGAPAPIAIPQGASVTPEPDFVLSAFETVFFVEPVAGNKWLTAARTKPYSLGGGNTSSGDLLFRVTDRAAPALSQKYGEASIGPAINDPAQLRTVDATVDGAGALFVGYVVDTLAGRQNLRVAKYLPVQGKAPVTKAEFDVLCRDQARDRSIVPDGQGGVFVRGFTWDPSNDQQLSVPYTRHFSATGALSWDVRGATVHQMAVSPSELTPTMVLGVGDGDGGLFEVLNLNGVTAKHNLAPQQDRARVVHRNADGSVAYDRAISLGVAGARGQAATAGAITAIFAVGAPGSQRAVVVFRRNGDDANRRLLELDDDGTARQVASFAASDFVLQAADGSVVVLSIRGGATTRYTLTRYALVGGALAQAAVEHTPEIPAAASVWPDEPSQVSLSPSGVVVIASSDKLAGRPTVAAMTLQGQFLGSAKSPGGIDMVVDDGARYFGYDRNDDGEWVYKGGAIHRDTSAAVRGVK